MASEIKVDTISEKTSAGGVTIDGLLIKDGNISGDVALAGTTPTFTIGDAGAEDATLLFDGNAQDYHVGLDDSSDSLVLGLGSTLGTTPAITINSSQVATFAQRPVFSSGITIADAGQIGSASDADAIAIASNGVVTFSQNPVFPDGGVAVADLDIDGATDIGAAIVDADLFIVDDGAGGTNRKVTASRIKTYAGGGGKVLQVQNTTHATQENITATGSSFADTGGTVSITPSATSSHVIVHFSVPFYAYRSSSDSARFNWRIIRTISSSDTTIAEGKHGWAYGYWDGAGAAERVWGTILNYQVFDSPNTTSACVYKMQMVNYESGTLYVQIGTSPTEMNAMEIDGS